MLVSKLYRLGAHAVKSQLVRAPTFSPRTSGSTMVQNRYLRAQSHELFCTAAAKNTANAFCRRNMKIDQDSTPIINVESQTIPNSSNLPPLVRTLKESIERNAAPFHFPGHMKGQAAPSTLTKLVGTKPFLYDITELPEQDRFFHPSGPLLEAKKLAAELFGAK
ncbi:Arginine decarboxylase [Handroanthus impetiginosus]|uniref:Arginine decarboxylase n=1 Tax=Handroanthus impetiginosus TaxID=429701 RepID=A0A2G9HD37_9LAMI|nr:Arginine decarboxylase [Handroanthus impetiginosus]